jgi:hypothetical protein
MPERLPEPARRLLERIDSVAQLEVLLQLHRSAPDEWSARSLADELRIEAAWAAEQLELLSERGLLARVAAGVYRFQPADPEVAKDVDALAGQYADRRVAVIALLYSKPTDHIRVFADAFRIRREGDGDG